MPAKKKNKSDKKGSAKKKKGAEDGFNASVCKKFLKHYQQKCEAVGALPYRSLVQDIAEGVEQDKLIEKFILEKREELSKPAPQKPSTTKESAQEKSVGEDKSTAGTDSLEVEPKMMVQPLLDSMRDTRYKNMTHLCLRGLPLVNADAATLTIFLGTEYVQALTTLELVRADITQWAFPQLISSLSSCKLLSTLSLDHNIITPPTLLTLSEMVKEHPTLTNLSLDFCHLNSECGPILGGMAAVGPVQSLSLVGNSLRCEGMIGLLGPVLEACEKSAKLPNLSKLYIMDNGIDHHSDVGVAGPVNCGRLIKKFLVVDPLLAELDLDTNLIGESASLEILDGLKQRKEAGHQPVRITVTHRITHETFKAIIDLSLSFGKKKKGKKGGKKKKKT